MILKITPDSPLAPLAGQRVKLIEALKIFPGSQLKQHPRNRYSAAREVQQ